VWPRGWVEVQLYSSMTAALEGGEWSAAGTGRTLPSGMTRYPLYGRLGGPQGRSGRAENLVPTGIRSRTVQPVAQSLYRLSYSAHIYYTVPLFWSYVTIFIFYQILLWTKWDPFQYYFCCTLIVVLRWPEDGPSRPKHVAKYHLIVIILSCLMCVVYWHLANNNN